MRKFMKNDILESFQTMYEAHDELKKIIEKKEFGRIHIILEDLQNAAIQIGTVIEKSEGEGFVSVKYLEEYCEAVYAVAQEVSGEPNGNKARKVLNKKLVRAENSVKTDIRVKTEVVFISYKASMWDSLESVWRSASLDPDCDAYVIAVPYYDLKPDRSFGQFHYEGDEYPHDVPITHYEAYDLAVRKPDVIYFHNPYDNWNLVTSVDPRFYSAELKKHTECLVYIPYYSTSRGMSAGQQFLPAYVNADYIVIQSPKLRVYFDKRIPDKKFLPFGSPKFDKVITKCQNQPNPPKEWAEKMKGRRVYFYNTSISGMLTDTESFLKKMEYVFKCFEGREDVCLLWRPHPLLESTFDSMRPQYRHAFENLKKHFIEHDLGIYDATSDVENTIALSDAYIGDAKSSITSLFGISGKPIFVLNENILEEAEDNAWRKDISIGFNYFEQDRFTVAQGNTLYVSKPYQYNYQYFCDLTEEKYENRYCIVYEIGKKWYACPSNAQSILVIGKNGVEKKIQLEKKGKKKGTFSFAFKYDKYLLLIPLNYPSVVRYDTVTGQVSYFTENIDVFVKEKNSQKITGCSWVYHGSLYVMSPVDNIVYKLDIKSGKSSIIEIPIQSRCGADSLVEYKDEFWLMPYNGKTIVRWNPETNVAKEYGGFPDGFICINPTENVVCEEKPFGTPVFYGKYLYLPSWWSNMSLQLDLETGIFKRWNPAFENENLVSGEKFSFLFGQDGRKKDDFTIYSFSRRKLYSINLKKNIYQEIAIQFDIGELENNEAGFCEETLCLPYACMENHFNTLDRFLQNRTVGNVFDREKQIDAYQKVNACRDGNSGKKVHEFIKNNLELT